MDTRDKRASVLGLGLAALLVLPAPGAIDQPDRQHLAYSYRGIAASVVTPIRLDDAIAYYQTTHVSTAAWSSKVSTSTGRYAIALPTSVGKWG